MENTKAGLLETLDTRDIGRFYIYLAVLATIGGFLFGFDSSNIGSALVFLPFKLGPLAIGIIVAGASLGSFVGALAAGPLTDRFGRKSLLLVDSGLFAVGSLISAFAFEPVTLTVGRLIIGIAIGADSAIATAYISEFAPKRRRGSLAIIQQWMITIGILAAYVIAVIVLLIAPSAASTVDWRILLGIGFIPAIISLILRARMPESPRWLLERGKEEKAMQAFQTLGLEVTEEDVHAEAVAVRAEKEQLAGQTQWTRPVRRALIIVSVFFILQQITGINVAFYYGPHLLGPYFAHPGTTAVQSEVYGVYAAGILAVVNVVATYFAFRFIDSIGRRRLAIGAYIGMTVFLLVGAYGATFLTGVPQLVVIMVGFALFISCFAIGIGGTGWLLQGEVFPTSVRGRASGIGAAVDWLANYGLVLVFPILQAGIGLGWVMIIFAVLCVVGIFFVYFFLPETKGHSVEQVVRLFDGPVNLKDPGKPSTSG
ncbi:sugar porter family MFS transporter [Planctomonas sp. JC2975]|uniref:sugar porter family MFS transporter n=1 Tax=Planctomonas sp. JC2975 TaxID=2729626 RepID=UPI001473D241|nr:sugar porter family MFS transporter [Planctomonas sp. JC2975]NNC12548.1 sugar porter family MFS transporter [Planctomonas sp. JC2975]